MSLRYLILLPFVFSLFSCSTYQTGAASAPPPDTGHAAASPRTVVPVNVVDSILATMTVDEKVGQMLMLKMPGNYISTQGDELAADGITRGCQARGHDPASG
jgi:hypothetical protein